MATNRSVRHITLFCLSLALTASGACSGSSDGRPNPSDAADTSDSSDSAETGDAIDTTDDADTLDAVDTLDSADTLDTLDIADSGDTLDTADTTDTADTLDSADSADTIDAADSADGGLPDEVPNEWGFHMRTPTSTELDCDGTRQSFDHQDWICTFDTGDLRATLYIAATPAECVSFGMSSAPTFDCRSEIAFGEGAAPVQNPIYDWGGNHHNDAIEFDFGGTHYRIYHSSFGFGFRSCNFMDCVQVGPPGAVTEDGCTCGRSIPAVCGRVTPEGTLPILVDTFAVCPGDSICGG